ncbi:MAG: TIGR03545 family protein [Nitrospiraceae bacterium]
MSKWVRWPGLIAFLVVVLLVVCVWLLVVDSVIKRTIKTAGTKLVGAMVDLEAADLSLFPLGLTLTGLQVTNPDAPMTNAVQVDRIAFLMDGPNLLRRKLIIEEMAVEGVRLNTPRRTSGAVAPQETPPSVPRKASGPRFTLPSFTVPDVREILAKEALPSLKSIESLRADIQDQKEQWQKLLAELPDKAKLEDYKRRLEAAKSAGRGGLGGIVGGAGELMAIQKDLRSDVDRIMTAKRNFEDTQASLRKRVDEAARAPQEELRRLKDKYSLSPQALTNLGGTLLGGTIAERTARSLRWYQKLKPFLERKPERRNEVEVVKPLRGKGVDVRFKEHAPLPDFLIRTAHVGVETQAGAVTGRVRHITPDQDILGVPLTFDFAGEKLKGLSSVKLDGELNHVDRSKPRDMAHLSASGYRITDMSLSENADWPLVLKEGLGDLNLRTELRGEALDAKLTAALQSVQMTAGTKGDAGPVAKALAAALPGVRGLHLEARVAGTLDEYDVRLSTDLDRVLKDAAGKQLQEQMARVEGELKAAIAEQVATPLADLKASLGGLDGIGAELAARLNQASGLTKATKDGGLGGLKLPF